MQKKIHKNNEFFSLNKVIQSKVQFECHDLVLDNGVQEYYDLILCRNVMIYFNQTLQERVLKTLAYSLKSNGILAVGAKESLMWCETFQKFSTLDLEEKIFRKTS